MKIRNLLLTTAALIFSVSSPLSLVAQAQGSGQTIQVTASKFKFSPAEATVKVNQPVEIDLKSTDVAHGLRFSEFNADAKIPKGGTAKLSFTPDKPGTFVGHCSTFCGSGHGSMTFTLHVVN